jgi:nucleoid DNA-binding protein
MNKTELIAAVAGKSGLSERQVRKALDLVLSEIVTNLCAGDTVTIKGFGTFSLKENPDKFLKGEFVAGRTHRIKFVYARTAKLSDIVIVGPHKSKEQEEDPFKKISAHFK